jgi:hypothetical protein
MNGFVLADCEKFPDFCSHSGVEGYPTLVLLSLNKASKGATDTDVAPYKVEPYKVREPDFVSALYKACDPACFICEPTWCIFFGWCLRANKVRFSTMLSASADSHE